MKIAILAAAAALLLPTAASAQQPAKPATTTVQPASKALGTRANEITAKHGDFNIISWARADVLNMRVNLDLNNLPVRDALKQVSEQAKQEIVIDNDMPQDTRITARAANVQLNTALDLITQAAGVRWSTQMKDGKTSLRVGKSVPAITFSTLQDRTITALTSKMPIAGNLFRSKEGVLYSYSQNESRSTFTCPHCKRQATVIRKAEAAQCPKCERAMQSNWQFCPNDGTKRPASQTAWKFCPFCSRAVSMTEATR